MPKDGIDADAEINQLETDTLSRWFEEHMNLKSKKPFSEIFSKFSEIWSWLNDSFS
jgi:hypothetical protein